MSMSILLNSSSGGGRGNNSHNPHLPIRLGLLCRNGDLSESHHDVITKTKCTAGRTLCDDLEAEVSKSYRKAYIDLLHDTLKTKKSHLRLRDNNNPQKMKKHIDKSGISNSVDAIAGCDIGFDPCFQSRDIRRPTANTQFSASRVREHIIALGDNPDLESAKEICRIHEGDFEGDKNADPHVGDYHIMPPICGKSSDRKAFETHLVDQNRDNHGELYENLCIEPAICADPEFDLHAAAVTASNFNKVQDWIIFYAIWHCAMHLMKCIFGDPMNLIHFFSVLFTEHLPYRKDHWKAAVQSLKSELAQLKNAAETQIAAAAAQGDDASEAMDALLR